MKDLESKHKNTILPKIDAIRTTLDKYVLWDHDTIQIYGPGGYTPTAEKAWRVWNETYENELMPDTLNPPTKGELATIIKSYLDLRRKYNNQKAFDKLWLCIPKVLYKQDSRFWEWFLSKVSSYLTVTLGGPDAWTDGTRQLWQEMEIYHLPTTADPKDPWGCECSAQTRITCWYLNYAQGPDKKKLMDPSDFEQRMEIVRQNNAQALYERFLNVHDPDFQIGSVDDYKTQEVVIDGNSYYAVGIPNVPTK